VIIQIRFLFFWQIFPETGEKNVFFRAVPGNIEISGTLIKNFFERRKKM